jgi:hypothetical protein
VFARLRGEVAAGWLGQPSRRVRGDDTTQSSISTQQGTVIKSNGNP